MPQVTRRASITLLSGAAVAWPVAARAQQGAMPVIGYLSGREANDKLEAAFHQGLKEAGFIKGQNVRIDYRWAQGQYDRLPALVAELLRRPVDVLVATGGTLSALAAKAATTSIPIVFVIGSDPITFGLVASLNRLGGKATALNQSIFRYPNRYAHCPYGQYLAITSSWLTRACHFAQLMCRDARSEPATGRWKSTFSFAWPRC
jgi:ABC-type uncharacterized transport system substrate-binding protein